jgi:cytochrome c-type biogenesis protein CcmF
VITAAGVILLRYKFSELDLIALLFASIFAAAANGAYIWKGLKGRFAHAGASIAHVGFALVLLGALISTSRQEEVSRNATALDLRFLNEGFSNSEDILLYQGDTVPMGDHYVHYKGKRQEGVNLYFDMDYLSMEPNRYRTGDTVRVGGSLFMATDDHVAGAEFLTDQPDHWTPLDEYPRRDLWHAPYWSPTRPGARDFALAPLVQLNPRFGNVAEPSTRHWLHRDLYTHIRYADLDVTDSTAFMPPRMYEKMIGDTIVTPTSILVMDSLRTVRDSVTISRLGPEFTVFMLRMRVRDLYDATRWFEARPILIYRGDQPAMGKGFELPELRVKYELASVTRTEQGVQVGLNVFEQEFVIMQAIAFPGINILWIGCVLLFLGTLVALRQRLRGAATAR